MVITSQLAVVNKSITSIITLLESVTLKNGRRVSLRDYLSSVIEETLNNCDDVEGVRRRLDFRAGIMLGVSLGRARFLLELLVTLLTVASFSQRPWHRPAPKTYTRALRAYQKLYKEKLSKKALLDPTLHVKIEVLKELESILRAVSKLFENTRNYINTYYPTGGVNKNVRSTANRLLTGLISGKLLVSPDTNQVLDGIIKNLLAQNINV